MLTIARFGPNTFPAHNSALFSCEVQVDYIARNMIAPLIDMRSSVFEVKSTVEHEWVTSIQQQLQGSVFQAGCSNWYINEHGHNAASWPGYASTYWKETCIPRWGIFNKSGGSRWWVVRMLSRWARTTSMKTYGLGLLVVALVLWRRIEEFGNVVREVRREVEARIGSLAVH